MRQQESAENAKKKVADAILKEQNIWRKIITIKLNDLENQNK